VTRLSTLNSWKEIADYLDRSVRTVQRWEARFGLPVRHRSGKRTAVFAIQAELDSWLQTRSRFRLEPHDGPQTFEAIFRHLPLAVAIVNDTRTCIDANPAMCRIVERPLDQLAGMHLDDFIIESERGSLAAAWETMLSTGSVTSSLLLRVLRADPRWVEFHAVARIAPGLHLVMLNTSAN
jgi:PAS domain S-box-containing protein